MPEFIEELNKKLKQGQLSDSDLTYYTEALFTHYRTLGFPNYENTKEMAENKFKSILNYNADKYYDAENKLYKKYQSFNGWLFSYFPNWIEVECGDSKSLKECWDDDTQLKKLLRKTLIWLPKHNEVFTTNRIRQNAKVFCASQTVSNFNPLTAKSLYDEFGNGGAVLDPCAGWGARMLGFIGSNCTKYFAYEVSSSTYKGLLDLKRDYNKYCKKNKIIPKEIILIMQACEDSEMKAESIDFVFTSPPYYNCEKYSNDESQSYIRYTTPDEWSEKFLGGMFKIAYRVLKPECVFALNIANTNKYNWIEDAAKEQAKKAGFKLEETRWYQLSSIAGNGEKQEPIFIFRKEKKEE